MAPATPVSFCPPRLPSHPAPNGPRFAYSAGALTRAVPKRQTRREAGTQSQESRARQASARDRPAAEASLRLSRRSHLRPEDRFHLHRADRSSLPGGFGTLSPTCRGDMGTLRATGLSALLTVLLGEHVRSLSRRRRGMGSGSAAGWATARWAWLRRLRRHRSDRRTERLPEARHDPPAERPAGR